MKQHLKNRLTCQKHRLITEAWKRFHRCFYNNSPTRQTPTLTSHGDVLAPALTSSPPSETPEGSRLQTLQPVLYNVSLLTFISSVHFFLTFCLHYFFEELRLCYKWEKQLQYIKKSINCYLFLKSLKKASAAIASWRSNKGSTMIDEINVTAFWWYSQGLALYSVSWHIKSHNIIISSGPFCSPHAAGWAYTLPVSLQPSCGQSSAEDARSTTVLSPAKPRQSYTELSVCETPSY